MMTTGQAIFELGELRRAVSAWAPLDLQRKLQEMEDAFTAADEIARDSQEIEDSLATAQQIVELQEQVEDRDREIADLTARVEDRDREIADLTARVEDRDREIAELKAQVKESEARCCVSEVVAPALVAVPEVPRLGLLMRARLLAELPDDDEAACDIVVGALAVLHGLRISAAWAPDLGLVPASDLDDEGAA